MVRVYVSGVRFMLAIAGVQAENENAAKTVRIAKTKPINKDTFVFIFIIVAPFNNLNIFIV